MSAGRHLPASERFMTRVMKTETCWLWVGALDQAGYGKFSANGRTLRAHRFAYESLVGPIPSGLVLDHLCRVISCVNPAHLEPVTNRENVLRGVGPTSILAQKTACLRGHAFTIENTRINRDGTRHCRVCERIRSAGAHAPCPTCGKTLRQSSIGRHLREVHKVQP